MNNLVFYEFKTFSYSLFYKITCSIKIIVTLYYIFKWRCNVIKLLIG